MSVESETANLIVHREHVAKVLARTGGEVMHPDHYDLREKIRLAILAAQMPPQPKGALQWQKVA